MPDKHGHRIVHGGLLHRHRLEPALEGGVLFDMLAVFVEGGGADDLDFPPGEGGLENVGGGHAALGVPGAHQVVHLVDEKDDVAFRLDLVHQALDAAFELAAELGARHEGGEIEQVDFLIQQAGRHLARRRCGWPALPRWRSCRRPARR